MLLGKEMKDIFATSKLIHFKDDVDDESQKFLRGNNRKKMIYGKNNEKKLLMRQKTFNDNEIKRDEDKYTDDEEENLDLDEEDIDKADYQTEEKPQDKYEQNLENFHKRYSSQQSPDQDQIINKQLNNNHKIYDDESFQVVIPQEESESTRKRVSVKFENHIIFEQQILSKNIQSLSQGISGELNNENSFQQKQ